MHMKMQLDNAFKNNQRPPKDLAILYKRLVMTIDKSVQPIIMPIQFSKPIYAKMLTSIMSVAIDSNTKINLLLQKVSSQGNASSIPGLSMPGAGPAASASVGAPSFPSVAGYGQPANPLPAAGAPSTG